MRRGFRSFVAVDGREVRTELKKAEKVEEEVKKESKRQPVSDAVVLKL